MKCGNPPGLIMAAQVVPMRLPTKLAQTIWQMLIKLIRLFVFESNVDITD